MGKSFIEPVQSDHDNGSIDQNDMTYRAQKVYHQLQSASTSNCEA